MTPATALTRCCRDCNTEVRHPHRIRCSRCVAARIRTTTATAETGPGIP